MDEVTVSFGVRDLVMMIGVGATAVGIGATWGQMRSEFRHLKEGVAKLEKIVTNGLSHKVDTIERRVSALPCVDGECDK